MTKVLKEMIIAEVIGKYPEAMEVMVNYGLHCIGCSVGSMESIESGAKMHGLSSEQIEEMIKKINEKINEKN